MEDLLDTLLFDSEPGSERRGELEDRLEENPDLADAWTHWCHVRARLREDLRDRLSDRRLLVLYVLAEEGHDEALTAEERAALDAAREDIARALDESPALETVVERIREEQADFEEAWAAHADALKAPSDAASTASEAASPHRDAERTDRAPRAPRSQESLVRRWTGRLAMAALVALIAVAALLLWPEASPTTTVTVADGATRVVTLDDGSTVRLAGPARLTYPTDRPEDAPRRVTLHDGRAFFDVPRDEDGSSFVVETPTATATVLGTQFGVMTAADTTEVVLASGSVRVGPAGSEEDGVVLKPGQKSWVAQSEAPAAPTEADLTRALEWTGLFVFRSVPLASIADRLERRYDVQITVADTLADEPVTGTFEREQSVEQILDALAATLGAEVQRDGDQYRLRPRPSR